jgi:hypothetical protein
MKKYLITKWAGSGKIVVMDLMRNEHAPKYFDGSVIGNSPYALFVNEKDVTRDKAEATKRVLEAIIRKKKSLEKQIKALDGLSIKALQTIKDADLGPEDQPVSRISQEEYECMAQPRNYAKHTPGKLP